MGTRHGWAVARLCFLTAALVGAWWGFHHRWNEIQDSLAQVDAVSLLFAVAVTCLGLLGTAVVWHTILTGFGAAVPPGKAASIFFVGQLGKYIPGSVWSVGAQAHAATRLGVAARSTAASSLVFLHIHVASGAVLVCLLMILGELPLTGTPPVWGAALLVGIALVSPWTLARIGGLLAGTGLAVDARGWGRILAGMTTAWLAYGSAVVMVAPVDGEFWLAVGAFAGAYVAGVVVIFVPAGLGVREVVMIVLLAPTLGVPTAAAVALVVRLVHTVADLLMALAAASLSRWPPARHAVASMRLP